MVSSRCSIEASPIASHRSPSQVPRVVLPEEVFVNIGVAIGAEVNRFLGFLQDISSGRNLKQFIMVELAFIAATF